ncbi:hypothetical protein LTR50_002701 [Elasticomyces elasticus]|nr:hypothetical protein LTR50_002701 [Elasticomyces elasticus]
MEPFGVFKWPEKTRELDGDCDEKGQRWLTTKGNSTSLSHCDRYQHIFLVDSRSMSATPVHVHTDGEAGSNPRQHLDKVTTSPPAILVKKTSLQASKKTLPCQKQAAETSSHIKSGGKGQKETTNSSLEPFPDFWNEDTLKEQELAMEAASAAASDEWEVVEADSLDSGWIGVCIAKKHCVHLDQRCI